MKELLKIYDFYNLRVRISVGIIILAPFILSLYLLVPNLQNFSFTIILFLITFGMCNLIISLSRFFSRNAINKCFSGLLPAQQMLLPNDTRIDPITKQRYHNFFTSNISNISFTQNNPHIEDSCQSAIKWLISQTRDVKKFPLINEESINFGLAKNLYGLKTTGIIISSSLFLLSVAGIIIKMKYSIDLVNFPNFLITTIVNLFYLLLWIFAISKKWVIDSGNKYARALLSACDSKYLN